MHNSGQEKSKDNALVDFRSQPSDQKSRYNAGNQKGRSVIDQRHIFYNQHGNDQLSYVVGDTAGNTDTE